MGAVNSSPFNKKFDMNKKFEAYKNKFVIKASENGYSVENINKCLAYAEPLISRDLPVIYNTSHFCSLVGYNKSYIKKAALYSKSFYRSFPIKKKDGGSRIISEPLPSMKEIQDWILQEILYNVKVSRYAKAYIHKRNIKDHVKYHTKSKKILTMDIKDFFGSIKFELVQKMFENIGYSAILSNLLTKLCFLENKLPQGAPTSPYISNIILNGFDDAMSIYCRENDIKYTRYADDLAFSGEIKTTELVKKVRQELNKLGLKIKGTKTKLMKQNHQQIISGIIVNQIPQVPKKERNDIRNIMFYIKKFGIQSHLEKTNQNKNNYLEHLLGKINYILSLNSADKEFIEYKQILKGLKNASR